MICLQWHTHPNSDEWEEATWGGVYFQRKRDKTEFRIWRTGEAMRVCTAAEFRKEWLQ